MTQPNAPLWPDGPTLEQAPGVFPMGTDSILLAAFAQLGPRDRLLDLGTATGLLPLLLLWDKPQATAAAVELSPDACQLARRNFQCNGLADRAQVLEGDLRDFRDLIPMGRFDAAVSRAVAPLNILAELCLPFVRVGGVFCAMKAKSAGEELRAASRAIPTLGGRVRECAEYTIPGWTCSVCWQPSCRTRRMTTSFS